MKMPRGALPPALAAAAVVVAALAALVAMGISTGELRAAREAQLLRAATALAAGLDGIDPFFAEPGSEDEALRRLRSLAGPLGLRDVAVLEIGDRTLVSLSGLTAPGAVEPAALADPEATARAWHGQPAVSEPFFLEGVPFQAAYAPLLDPEGRPAAILVATAGREAFGALDRVQGLYQGVVAVSTGLVLGIGLLGDRLRRRQARTEAELEHAARLSTAGAVAAGVAHEVRNPLGIIRSSIELAKDRPGATDEARELLGSAIEEIDRIEDILARFLALAGPGPSEPTRVELAAALEDVARLAGRDMARRGIALAVRAEPGVAVRIDPRGLKQALLNLLINARQALEARPGGERSVELVLEADPDLARIAVRDRGPGFPAGILEGGLGAFRTLREGGTGLGLALVARLIDAAGGTVRLTARPGGGAEVVLELPRIP